MLQTTVVKGFEVVESDGCGVSELHVAYFSNEKAASELATRSPNWMRVVPFEKTFKICDNLADYDEMKNTKVREQALAKLTQAEKLALGLV